MLRTKIIISNPALVFLIVATGLIYLFIFMPAKVNAAGQVFDYENGSTYPASLVNTLDGPDFCGRPQNSAQSTWLSLENNPGVQSVQLRRGDPLRLNYNVVTTRCFPDRNTGIFWDYFRPVSGNIDFEGGPQDVNIPELFDAESNSIVIEPPNVLTNKYRRGAWSFSVNTWLLPESNQTQVINLTVEANARAYSHRDEYGRFVCIMPPDQILMNTHPNYTGNPNNDLVNICPITTERVTFQIIVVPRERFDVDPYVDPLPSLQQANFSANNHGNGASRLNDGAGVNITRRIYINNPTPVYNVTTREIISSGALWQQIIPLSTLGLDLNSGDKLCAEIIVQPAAGITDVTGIGDGPIAQRGGWDVNCQVYYAEPYFRVYGGDTAVGRGIGDNCTHNTNATIKAKVRPVTGGGWGGSGSQFAARATGKINGFLSASLHKPSTPPMSRSSAEQPTGLTLGNSQNRASVISGTFVDNIDAGQDGAGAYKGCIRDYYKWASEHGEPVIDANNVNAQLGAEIGVGESKILYFTGNVRIRNNIKFNQTAARNDVGDIPQFVLVVKGNIYIDPGVTQLDGLYVAQPTTPNNGIIDTCWTNSVGAEKYAPCGNRLEFNGAVVSKKILLNRINGELADVDSAEELSSSGNIAEVFNFSPEVLLALPSGLPTLTPQPGIYNSIIGLPPIL